jgi:putative GTP pyrophosphokinase
MRDPERSKARDLLEGMLIGHVSPELESRVRDLLATEHLYLSATREIATKLEVLNDEFKQTRDRNPIHSIKTRVKSPKSIADKLTRRGHPVSVESARQNLTDIAGIRVICPYLDDIYTIARLLVRQDDVTLVRSSDYIKNPKPNGYRSLHLVVTVPVFLSDRTECVPAEIQIRTIAMDFWASLEHELGYKLSGGKTPEIEHELKACADVIAETDRRMQALFEAIAPTEDPAG